MTDKAAPKLSQTQQQDIIKGFQLLRNEQRTLISKITELEQDLNEHKVVLESLGEVSDDRRCFRMVGGVLVERTVAEVVPALSNNRDKLSKLLENLNETLSRKGTEMNEYREANGIRVRGQDANPDAPEEGSVKPAASSILVNNA